MRRAALALAAVLSLSCAKPLRPGDKPLIRAGDACARCGMAISEERFSAGYVDAEGRSVVYDDLGEFLEAAASEPRLMRGGWVHDGVDGRWLRASEAFIVQVEGTATPMGTGYLAFADQGEARSFLQVRGLSSVSR